MADLSTTESLDLAEREIGEGKLSAAALLLRDVLGRAASPRALDLVERIYDGMNGAPGVVEDAFPAELEGMTFVIDRFLRRPNEVGTQPGDHVIAASLSAPFDLRSRVSELKVTKLPSNTVVIDARDQSQWGLGINRDDPNRFLTKTLTPDFNPDGLYSVSVVLNDAAHTQVSTWFLVSHGLGTADPNILSPANQPLTVERPDATTTASDSVFRFADFKSDRNKPYEQRELTAILRYHQFIDGQRSTSSYYKGVFADPRVTEIQAGHDGVPTLMSGEYRFAVDYHELRSFGHLRIGRGSQTIVRFFVDPPPVASCEAIPDAETCKLSQSEARGVCVFGFQGKGCVGVADTNPIAGRCDILHSPAACSFHDVSCVWKDEACVLKP